MVIPIDVHVDQVNVNLLVVKRVVPPRVIGMVWRRRVRIVAVVEFLGVLCLFLHIGTLL